MFLLVGIIDARKVVPTVITPFSLALLVNF